MFRMAIAILACLILAPAAQARVRSAGPQWNGSGWVYQFLPAPAGTVIVHRHPKPRNAGMAWHRRMERHFATRPPPEARVSGLVAPLAAKVAEIAHACGSHVISAVRHTFIAGTRRISLHASGKAADVSGNPSCIYSMLHGWPGGYSIDYGRVGHVHISYDPEGHREWGARFVHGGHRRHYARHHRHHHRYS